MCRLLIGLGIEPEKVKLQQMSQQREPLTFNSLVLPGWEGSATDGQVLRDAVSRKHGLVVPRGKTL